MFHKLNPTAIGCLVFLIAATQATAAFNDYSMLFDGGDEYINTVDMDELDGIDKLSLFAWIKQPSLTAFQAIVVKWDFQTQGTFGFMTGRVLAGGLTVYIATSLTDNGQGSRTDTSNVVLTSNEWANVGFVFDGTQVGNTNRLKIYVNGVSVGLTQAFGNVPSSLVSNGTATVKIGKWGGTLDQYFDGNIDEASVWNKGLTTNEVSELYNSGYPGNLVNHSTYSNLVSWWRMGDGGTWDGTNWSIPDLKSSNDGISTNMEYSDRSQEVPPAPPIPSGTAFMAR